MLEGTGIDPEEQAAIAAVERDEDARTRDQISVSLTRATWLLVVITLVGNISISLVNWRLEADTRQSVVEAHNAAQGHIFPTGVLGGNGPQGTVVLVTTGLVYEVRDYCVLYTLDAPEYGRFTISPSDNPEAREVPVAGPGGGVSVSLKNCQWFGSALSPQHPAQKILFYYLYRQADGTPREGAIAFVWDQASGAWSYRSAKDMPQYGDFIQAARTITGEQTFMQTQGNPGL